MSEDKTKKIISRKVIPMPGGGIMARKRMLAIQKKAAKEFRDWKAALCDIVNRTSKLEFNKDGTYQFLLPTRLIRLVWATTIKERIAATAAAAARNNEKLTVDAIKQRAMIGLQKEVAEAQDQFLDRAAQEKTIAESAAKTKAEMDTEEAAKPTEEEEASAAETLAKYREEMLKEQE